MKYIIFLCSIFMLFFACSESEEPYYIKLSDNILKPFSQKIQKKYFLRPLGGGGGFMDSVNKIYLAFTSSQAPTLDQCRKEYVEMVAELLSLYNHNEEIRPYLGNYPFKAENVNILILYSTNPKLDIPDRVYSVNMHFGEISFHMADIDSMDPKYYIRETFEEAYFKVYGKEWKP